MQHGRPLCCRWHQGAAFVISGPDASALPQTPSQFHRSDRAAIAKRYGLLTNTLVSWIKTLAFVRNISAHHARLWNAGIINQPLVPKPFEAPQLVHIGSDLERRTRVYGAAAVASYFVRRINRGTSWPSRMKAHWQAFPAMPFASPIQGGFLAGWDAEAIWA
jgi:abortive infection bacteriophage resistance protein